MKKALLFALLLFICLPLLGEDADDLYETEAETVTEEESLTPYQRLLKYSDDMNSHYNMTNYLKEVIVIMHPILAEAALADLFVKEQPEAKDRSAFLKKWAGEYKTLLTNGYGFRLIFQLKHNFLDQQNTVTIPKNIADYFTLLSSSGVRVKACRCVSDQPLPKTISFECSEVNVDLYFNTRDEKGRPLINPKTKAIRLQSAEVNADFGSYNFSWWLPFKYPIKRPVEIQRICGSRPYMTFVAAHPEVFSKEIVYENASGSAGASASKIAAAKIAEAKAAQNKPARKPIVGEERSALIRRAVGFFLGFGFVAP
ncbi:hypothetical protein IKW72_05415 [bacterium]|nr:hypothetical protein [bacterium]